MLRDLCAFGVAICVASGLPGSATAQESWALTHVTVVDVVAGRNRPNQTIYIRDNRIVAVGPADSLVLPSDVRRIDEPGAFVIPGLYDMHTHFVPSEPGDPGPVDSVLRARVREGVLGVRDLGSPLDSIVDIAKRRALNPEWPRIWFAGPILDGPQHSGLSYRIVVTDTGAAKRAVDQLSAAGVQFIKVHDWLSPTVYAAITQEARSVGLPVVGHIPAALSAEDVIRAGQRSVEHLGGLTHGVLRGCSKPEPSRDARVAALGQSDQFAAYRLALSRDYLNSLFNDFDVRRCSALAEQFVEHRVTQVPTLVIFRSWAQRSDSALARWSTDRRTLLQLLTTQLRVVGLMQRAGVPILAGCDAVPGVTIHDELELLVEAGLSPAEALRAATIAPAEFLGATDSLGTVAAGRLADFVVLRADPLLRISNTRRIEAVVLRGRWLPVNSER